MSSDEEKERWQNSHWILEGIIHVLPIAAKLFSISKSVGATVTDSFLKKNSTSLLGKLYMQLQEPGNSVKYSSTAAGECCILSTENIIIENFGKLSSSSFSLRVSLKPEVK